MPIAFLVFAAAAAVISLLLVRTRTGIAIYLIGSNERATRFSGVDTRRVQMGVYMLSGLLCGLAGVVMLGRFNSASSSYGSSYLLVTILAAVLGGVDPAGGFGGVAGLVIALLVLQVVATGLTVFGLSGHATLAAWGLILIGTVAAGPARVTLRRRWQRR